jgi:leucyl aminopeptidase
LSISIRHARSRPAAVDALAVAVTAENFAGVLDEDGPGGAYATASGFTARRGQTLVVPGPKGSATVYLGLGPDAGVDATAVRKAAAAFVRVASRRKRLVLDLIDRLPDHVDGSAAVTAAAEGILLGSYRFDAHRSAPPEMAVSSVRIVAASGRGVAEAIARGEAIGRAVCWARDLVNEPGGSMTATEVAAAVRAMGRREKLKVTVMDGAAIRKAGMGGLIGVNRGSEQPPRFVRVSYIPVGASAGTDSLVGKGITFDSGRLSIKTAEGMKKMKDDMGGGAAVLAAVSALP